MSNQLNYNEEMQELFLRFMVSDGDIIARVNNIVQPICLIDNLEMWFLL